MTIRIGNVAGWTFRGQADLEVAHHCTDGHRNGFYVIRKRLVDREAFAYDPHLGWELDKFFEWPLTSARPV